jgi:CheY-like chemotaxis protein/HPt (histidine-containing phosphotransfer) domain-containing protein
VLADRHRFKQVLLNLLSNAVKYNRPGGEVRVSAGARTAGRVRLVVCDTGIGISTANLDRVFTAFERLGAETTVVEGTGLGLTLTKRLIEAMAGTVGVESEVGSGTTFWIELAVVEAPQAHAMQSRGSASTAARPRRPARTVLYIEDNPSNVKLVEAILTQRPEVTLLVATQGGLGLELAREHRPTVVLLDLNLPDMSGEQVLRRMRSDERTADATIVILSADATPGQIARLRRAGADDYLTKPFEIERFLAVIDGEMPAAAASDPGGGPDPGGPLRPDRIAKLRRLYPDDGALRTFVELFLADMTMRIDDLQTAARAGDAPAVWQAAHAMRGSSSIAGAHRVHALLARFEAVARRDDVPDEESIDVLWAAFDDAAQAVMSELA